MWYIKWIKTRGFKLKIIILTLRKIDIENFDIFLKVYINMKPFQVSVEYKSKFGLTFRLKNISIFI